MDLDFLEEQSKRLDSNRPEETLGKGILQPFNASNSGSRKQMFNTHNSQKVQLLHSEVPYISTGYENKFGELSSNFIVNNSDYKVVAKIPKFSKNKSHINYMIYFDYGTNKYDVFEITPYNYTTEVFGYLNDNDYLNSCNVGTVIPKGTVISKSASYDEYNNRKDGVNLLTCYMAVDDTKEDSIIISESASKKLAFPMFKKIKIDINENDIPLNLYGNNTVYKFIPDILEYTKENHLCSIRRKINGESLYMQSEDRLTKTMFGDTNFIANGQIIDINIYCNNPERLGTTAYDSQLKYYYDDHIRLCNDIISLVDALGGVSVTGPKLHAMYSKALDCIHGKKYQKSQGQVFSNILLEVVILDKYPMHVSDKMSNRYGGKGVISKIVPDEYMPHTEDGRVIEVIQTKNTVIGRENIGQLWEMHINHISGSIVKAIRSNIYDIKDAYNLYVKFISMLSRSLYDCEQQLLPYDKLTDQDIEDFVDILQEEDYLYLSVDPIKDNMTIDKLKALYDEFPMAKPENLLMPIISSAGEVEYTYSNRPLIYAPEYYYRLKQISEEKMSATSMSAINHKELNTKSKSSKQGKEPLREVPARLGNQEDGDLRHLGSMLVIFATSVYANSPTGRRQCEDLLTGDNINPDIKLNSSTSSRTAAMVALYLKTKGIRLGTKAHKKCKQIPFVVDPFIDNHSHRNRSMANTSNKADNVINPFVIEEEPDNGK